MVIDTSAIVAVLADEPERHEINSRIANAGKRLISAGTYLETAIVIRTRFGADGLRNLRQFVSTAGLQIVPFDADQAVIASEAYDRYGKGRHPAGMNFGDCFAYALSRAAGEPLLFKGGDFAKTDVLRMDA
jgi:ribonuclease VapC